MRHVDVAIVGAGPGGTAAAIELARAGREVVVIDKATFPRDKCCGDGLTTGALRHLEELGLRPSSVASWAPVDACWVRSPSGRTVRFGFPTDGLYGAVARRVDLDASLVHLARAAGAEILEGHGFSGLRPCDGGVVVEADGLEPIATRYLVAADGMWSPVRKAVGLGDVGYRGEWHAFRQYLRAPGEQARRLWVWFERDLLPGYAWSFPLPDGRANVGFGIRRVPGTPVQSMAETWRRLLDVPHIRATLGEGATPDAPHKAWPIPTRLPAALLSALDGRVLLVGDAARAGDPLTGEGIGQALETGRCAARSIIAGGPAEPAGTARRYRDALARTMAVDHRVASVLSRVMASDAGARSAVRLAGTSAWTRRHFARWLFEDYPRAMVLTPSRWHRGAFPGSGAFAVPGSATPGCVAGGAGIGQAATPDQACPVASRS